VIPKVSVVVPVFDPGTSIEPCIASLLAQTMPPEDVELIFVDDGSTDDAPARLDRLATEHPNVRVIHTPNSGWPGRPRNIGIAQATGEYIHFVDQDDALAPQALERLYAMAHRNDSDIVLGKVVSDFRPVAHDLYRRDRDRCSIQDAPLIDSLTPHKLFRRGFLLDNGITYPEGKRRLEDQLFVVRAYFAASNISILAGDPCYFYRRRADGKNAGHARIEPALYYANVREVLDVVLAKTAPGPERTRLVRRFVRQEMLVRLKSEPYLQADDAAQQAWFDEVRALLLAVADRSVIDSLGAVARVRATLAMSGDRHRLARLDRRLQTLKMACRIEACTWVERRLRIVFEIGLRDADGAPWRAVSHDDRLSLDPGLFEGSAAELTDMTADATRIRLPVGVVQRETAIRWTVPTKISLSWLPAGPDGGVTPVLHCVATLDPRTVAGRRPLDVGTWDVVVQWAGLGLDIRRPLAGPTPVARSRTRAAVIGEPASRFVPRFDAVGGFDDALCLDVTWSSTRAPRPILERLARVARSVGSRLPPVVRRPLRTVYRSIAGRR
jgi:poly(ribitol-phosphate) beta-N-acetylglucosaminyltransferase